jgi:hypothetical protein
MTATEAESAERAAYIAGDTEKAALLGTILDLLQKLQDALEGEN